MTDKNKKLLSIFVLLIIVNLFLYFLDLLKSKQIVDLLIRDIDKTIVIFATLAGAIIGGLIPILYDLSKNIFVTKRQIESIKRSLYYEIEQHLIIELPKSGDNPNFYLVGFANDTYLNNISILPKIFNEDKLHKLTSYYSALQNVNSYQKELLDIYPKIFSDEYMRKTEYFKFLEKQKEGIEIFHRYSLAFALNSREILLTDLRKVFKEDPSRNYLDVLPKHQEWFKKEMEKHIIKDNTENIV